MAEKASKDRIEADMRPADYRSAVLIIREEIGKKKEKIAGINGQIGDQWAKVEGYKVNKKAGKIFATLDKMDQEERVEVIRSLNGLMDVSGWDETAQDLADLAEGNVVHMRVRTPANADDGADGDEGNGEDGGAEEADAAAETQQPAPRRGRKPKAADLEAAVDIAKEAAKRKDALTQQAPEIYTGDNSDLAGED